MKKFNFTLESVLKLKTHKVDDAKNELGKVIAEINKRNNQIDLHRKEIGALLNDETGNSIAFMQARFHRVQFLEAEINKLYGEIEQIRKIEEQRREALKEAKREEMTYEKLKEKQLLAFKEEMKKDEAAFIDEIAGKRAANQSRQ